MRLPYIGDDPKMETPAEQEAAERIKKRRGGQLLELDKTLLYAPPLAEGWNDYLGAIRTRTTLPDSIRELSILRVATLNQAWYEWDQHVALLEQTGDLSQEEIERLKDVNETGEGLDPKHRAVLQVTDAMTKNIVVPDAKFDELKKFFSDRQVVEIVSTVAAYNCVSRFLVALDVGEMSENHKADTK